MFHLPHNRRTRIQLTLVTAFLLAFYFGVRYTANWIESGADFLELRDAIERGNMDDIERKLNASASPNVRNPDGGETALHVAIGYENREVVELLFEHGANPNVKDQRGHTPLHAAAWKSPEITRLLLKHGANPNLKDQRGHTPLHAAARNSPEITRLLLDNGADADVVDDGNHSPIHRAAEVGSMETVRLLVEHGSQLHGSWSPGAEGTPSRIALASGHANIAKYILFEAGGGDLSEENLDALLDAAASAGDIELVRMFYEAGADPDVPDVRQVWHEGGMVYIGSIASAVMSGSAEVVETLIELGATLKDPQRFKEIPLSAVAANRNDAAMITLLLDHGLDVNYADNMGQTALHAAARHDAAEAAQALIEGGADVNAGTNYGATPIYYAAESSSVNVLELLLENGADPSKPDDNGATPTSIARLSVMRTDLLGTRPEERENARAVLDLLERHAPSTKTTESSSK